jgi:hypothetical protein
VLASTEADGGQVKTPVGTRPSPNEDLPPAEPYSSPLPRSVAGRIAVGAILVGFVGMWVYIFGFAKATNPDLFPDRAWSSRANTACAATAARIKTLPVATSFKDVKPLSEALRQRADVADKVTAELRTLVAGMKADPAGDAKTTKGLSFWLRDWDTYIADRDRHVADWRAGLDKPFDETQNEKKQPTSYRMDPFAKLNRMPACVIPDDLG